jgi:hypothetical protein
MAGELETLTVTVSPECPCQVIRFPADPLVIALVQPEV